MLIYSVFILPDQSRYCSRKLQHLSPRPMVFVRPQISFGCIFLFESIHLFLYVGKPAFFKHSPVILAVCFNRFFRIHRSISPEVISASLIRPQYRLMYGKNCVLPQPGRRAESRRCSSQTCATMMCTVLRFRAR